MIISYTPEQAARRAADTAAAIDADRAQRPAVVATTSIPGRYRTGTVTDLTVAEVTAALGFAPNGYWDEKVENEWLFTVDGHECAVWDYYGARFSCYDPDEVLARVFGAARLNPSRGWMAAYAEGMA